MLQRAAACPGLLPRHDPRLRARTPPASPRQTRTESCRAQPLRESHRPIRVRETTSAECVSWRESSRRQSEWLGNCVPHAISFEWPLHALALGSNPVARYRSREKMCHRCHDKHSGHRRCNDRVVERRLPHQSYRSNDLRYKCQREYRPKDFRSGMNKMDTADGTKIKTNPDVQSSIVSQCPCDSGPCPLRDECRAARRGRADC